jgi:hypothetical protein
MKKNKWLWISFICLVAVFALTGFLLIQNKAGQGNSSESRLQADCINVLIESMRLTYKMNNHAFNYTLEDAYGNVRDLFKPKSAETQIVLRYSELNCSICVDSAIAAFVKFGKGIGPGKAIILVESKSSDYISQFIRFNHIDVPLYRITKKDEPDDVSEEPFLFVLDSTRQMKDVFYPHKEMPGEAVMYYNTMYDKYFKK